MKEKILLCLDVMILAALIISLLLFMKTCSEASSPAKPDIVIDASVEK